MNVRYQIFHFKTSEKYIITLLIFLLDHGQVSEDWKEWDKCKAIESSSELYQTRRKHCENIWSPNQNKVTCDPILPLEETRVCHIGK